MLQNGSSGSGKREHISFSEMGLWNTCQWRWKLDVLEGRKHRDNSIFLAFGTSIHAAIELMLAPSESDRQPIDVCKFFFRRKLEHEYDQARAEIELTNRGPVDLNELFLAGDKILSELAVEPLVSSGQVVFNEFKLFEQIGRTDGLEMKFKGFIDIVLKSQDKRGKSVLYVCDFKTCSWGWSFDKKRDENLHAQVLLYKHFLCKKFGLDPKNVRTVFILLKRKPRPNDGAVELFQISSGPKAVQRALDDLSTTVTEISKKIESGAFLKNRNACETRWGRCPYYGTDQCDAAGKQLRRTNGHV